MGKQITSHKSQTTRITLQAAGPIWIYVRLVSILTFAILMYTLVIRTVDLRLIYGPPDYRYDPHPKVTTSFRLRSRPSCTALTLFQQKCFFARRKHKLLQ